MSASPIIATTSLVKEYRSTTALNGIDLAVPEGSVYGLVGPNGAGKTTLLGILAGLRHPTSGSATVAVARSRLAVLPDTPRFEPWLTAWEVVDLARALSAPELPSERVMDVLTESGLADVATWPVGGFSRGMLQRLGLAATIVGEPEVLLLDEPSSALDPAGRREVLDLVARLRGRATVLFSSHILSDVQEVCDTVGILRSGDLLFQGPLSELLVGRAGAAFQVKLRAEPEGLVDALSAQPWVVAVDRPGPDELIVSCSQLETGEVELVQMLSRFQTPVISIAPAGADLERVFLELTS